MKHVIHESNPEIKLARVRNQVQACIQCGTCTGSCPNAFAMDITPRHMWRLVITGRHGDLFKTRTFDLCSSCYVCTLRCPRGLPLTEAMGFLKQYAAKQDLIPYRKSISFYRSFMESVRRHGRVREMEMMTLYFMAMKSPFIPLKFAPLGLKLMGKRKVRFEIPMRGKGVLNALFAKVRELEEQT